VTIIIIDVKFGVSGGEIILKSLFELLRAGTSFFFNFPCLIKIVFGECLKYDLFPDAKATI